MRTPWLLTLISLAVSCTGGSDDSIDPGNANPPADPPSLSPPSELAAVLERDEDGKPILFSWSPLPNAGVTVNVVYDEMLDTPHTRWAACLDRVLGCYQTNAKSIKGCVGLIAICSGAAGEGSCCPKACVDRFSTLIGAGLTEDLAVDQSFLEGSCVDGFTPVTRALRGHR